MVFLSKWKIFKKIVLNPDVTRALKMKTKNLI